MSQDDQPPDIYTNAVQIYSSGFDLTMELKVESPGQTDPSGKLQSRVVARVRMSLEHAKVLAIILRKNLQRHEECQGGPVRLHPEILKHLGISKDEDW